MPKRPLFRLCTFAAYSPRKINSKWVPKERTEEVVQLFLRKIHGWEQIFLEKFASLEFFNFPKKKQCNAQQIIPSNQSRKAGKYRIHKDPEDYRSQNPKTPTAAVEKGKTDSRK